MLLSTSSFVDNDFLIFVNLTSICHVTLLYHPVKLLPVLGFIFSRSCHKPRFLAIIDWSFVFEVAIGVLLLFFNV